MRNSFARRGDAVAGVVRHPEGSGIGIEQAAIEGSVELSGCEAAAYCEAREQRSEAELGSVDG
jgi:hypothetical protein